MEQGLSDGGGEESLKLDYKWYSLRQGSEHISISALVEVETAQLMPL